MVWGRRNNVGLEFRQGQLLYLLAVQPQTSHIIYLNFKVFYTQDGRNQLLTILLSLPTFAKIHDGQRIFPMPLMMDSTTRLALATGKCMEVTMADA